MLKILLIITFLALVREVVKQVIEYQNGVDDAIDFYQRFTMFEVDMDIDFYNHVSELKKERIDMRGCWNPIKRYNYIVRYIRGETYTPYIKNIMMRDNRYTARLAKTYLKTRWR